MCIASFAQVTNTAESADGINAIKRDSKYIYAESTRKDPVEAQSDARAILELKVADWVKSNYPEEDKETCVAKARENWADLSSHRGNYCRVLVFVKKGAIVSKAEQPEEEEDSVIEDVFEPVLTPDEDNIAAIVSFDSIEPYIKGLKNEGRVQAYGKYFSLPRNVPCYVLVYNTKDGNIVAALRQSEDGQYFNLRTMLYDNLRNYKKCGAFWLQLK